MPQALGWVVRVQKWHMYIKLSCCTLERYYNFICLFYLNKRKNNNQKKKNRESTGMIKYSLLPSVADSCVTAGDGWIIV